MANEAMMRAQAQGGGAPPPEAQAPVDAGQEQEPNKVIELAGGLAKGLQALAQMFEQAGAPPEATAGLESVMQQYQEVVAKAFGGGGQPQAPQPVPANQPIEAGAANARPAI